MPIVLAGGSSYDISGHMEQFVDETGTMTLEGLLAGKAVRFVPISNNVEAGKGHQAVWVRMRVMRTSPFPGQAWLQLYPSYLENVTLYEQTGSDPTQAASYRRTSLGAIVPAAERPLVHPEFVAPIVLKPDGPGTIYLCVRSNTTLMLAGALHTLPGLISCTSKITIIDGGYLIMTLVLTVVNVLIFLRLRDSIYLIFAFWVLSLFCSALASSGMITLVLPAVSHRILVPLYGAGLGIGGLLLIALAMTMFETKRVPRLHHALLLVLGGALLALFFVPVATYGETVPFFSNAAFLLLFFVYRPEFRETTTFESGRMFFLIAYIFTFLAYTVQFLLAFGWIAMNWWWINTLYFVSIVDMVLMFLAFLNRLHMAEMEMVNLAKGAEQKAMQLASEMTLQLRERENRLELALAAKKITLEQQQRLIEMLSHEYRTPLTVIRGNIDIIEIMEEDNPEKYRNNLNAIQISIDRLIEIMDVSLEQNRIADKENGVDFERILLEPFLALQVADARIFWPRLVFNHAEAQGEHYLLCNPQYLKTAIFNLLDNARKYSIPDSPIEVKCSIEGDDAVIRIENQTAALAMEEPEVLFEKYKRGRNSANTSGAGIGLWLIRQIIGQHNGSVTLEHRDSGVVATVRLPLADQAEVNSSSLNNQ